jgi:hypothetical protein
MDRKQNEPRLISRRQAAERWSCSTETLKRREKAGMLKVLKIGPHVRYRVSDIEAIEAAAEIE